MALNMKAIEEGHAQYLRSARGWIWFGRFLFGLSMLVCLGAAIRGVVPHEGAIAFALMAIMASMEAKIACLQGQTYVLKEALLPDPDYRSCRDERHPSDL